MDRTFLSISTEDERETALLTAYRALDDAGREALEAYLAVPHPAALDLGEDDWQLAAAMYKHQGVLALDRLVTEIGEAWSGRMVKGMLNSRNPVDQREIDERRGWYTGARYALRVLPYRAHRRAMKALEETEEVED